MASLVKAGTSMRHFTANVVKADGATVALWSSDEVDDEYILLYFFPMINAVDSTEVLSLKDNLDKFSGLKCKVLGVTDESVMSVKSWIKASPKRGGFGGPVGFDIICDRGLAVASMLGAKTSSGEPARATYILDKQRKVRYSSFYPRYVGRDVDTTVTAVTAVKEMDDNNAIIPSGWEPGDKTIKDSPDGLNSYYGLKAASTVSSATKSIVSYSSSEIESLAPSSPKYAPSTKTVSTESSEPTTIESRAITASTIPVRPSTVESESDKSEVTEVSTPSKASSVSTSPKVSTVVESVETEKTPTPPPSTATKSTSVLSWPSEKPSIPSTATPPKTVSKVTTPPSSVKTPSTVETEEAAATPVSSEATPSTYTRKSSTPAPSSTVAVSEVESPSISTIQTPSSVVTPATTVSERTASTTRTSDEDAASISPRGIKVPSSAASRVSEGRSVVLFIDGKKVRCRCVEVLDEDGGSVSDSVSSGSDSVSSGSDPSAAAASKSAKTESGTFNTKYTLES